MKKMKLALDDLTVDSFSIEAATGRRGTVRGNLVDTTGDDYSYGAGCTQYCETDGGGRGLTCDIRCYPSSKCNWGTQFNAVTCQGYDPCSPTVALSCDDPSCSPDLC
ncbi:MAG TPA: hypothetical protein VF665_25130 [Longimicrobium sp.]|jgi:hypothetical protein|uniref:hypothetical protein n=1 Tax=Longimicrobium sp. TaxID=2029185 RepID=UPI002EDAA1D6